MARTSDPHAAAIKAWDTRGRAQPGSGSNPTQLRQDYFVKEGWGKEREFKGPLSGHASEEDVRRFTKEAGMEMSRDEVADLVGAPPGSKVAISLVGLSPASAQAPAAANSLLTVTVGFPDDAGNCRRIIDLKEKVIYNTGMHTRIKGKGLGLAVFEGEVDAALKRGFKGIEVDAIGGPDDRASNGYYTWARFGFEALVKGPDGRDVFLTKLMMQPGGAQWWKAHGESFSGRFDLTPTSRSMRVFAEYRRLKKEAAIAAERSKREEMRLATEEANRRAEESIRRSAEWMAKYRKEHPNEG